MNESASTVGRHRGESPTPTVPDRRSTIPSNSSTTMYDQRSQNIISTGVSTVPSVQQNQQHNISSRYLPNERVNNITNQHVVTQQHQQTILNPIYNINSNVVTNTHVSNIGVRRPVRDFQQSTDSLQLSTQNPTQSQTNQIIDNSNLLSPISRKRLKSDIQSVTTSSSSYSEGVTCGTNVTRSDINILKKRILEHKYLRLKNIKEKYQEHVAELFFLQSGGSMMEYPAWRKKQPSSLFINFNKSYRLHGHINEDLNQAETSTDTKVVVTSSTTLPTTLPQGTEIKIPGVGITPVAVSTTLPPEVVELTQQGHIPGRPQGGRHGMVFGQIPVPSAIGNLFMPLMPGGTPIVPNLSNIETNINLDKKSTSCNTTSSIYVQNTTCSINGGSVNTNTSHDQFSVKAKQEVYVMQRISELQRDGLWTERRLPKLQEPTRPKAHWDYLLEEMVWLAADFAQERKWKKNAAKKCSRMVQKYFQDKANAVHKAEKAQEVHLKRVAAFIAKEIKFFWSNVEKLVEYKHQTKLEEKRKRALDQHLSFIVDQTEKFSQQLTEGMNKTIADTSAAPSLSSSRISSPKYQNLSDDEFCPITEDSDDDEETIAKAEEEAADVNEEIIALQRESQMDFDDILKSLPKDYLQNRDKIVLTDDEYNSDHYSGDEEFKVNGDSSDDEDTIMEQENTEKGVDHKKEVDELNADNEMSLDDLLIKYKNDKSSIEVTKMVSDDELENEEDSDDVSIRTNEDESIDERTDSTVSETEDESSSNCLKSLLVDNNEECNDNDNLINDAAAIAESIQPKGNTLSSTNVVTPVPFLLKHTLREYQHIGLDWLVTMHDRKLNGILADEMGLGKTIQTIALLAHLACVRENWGPHLIVVPSSVMLNWEMEFKKWCPGFKILTYYGTQKERKQKRIGWTKFNAFHVCITSYKLVIQDQQSFRRKKWKYLILDEAQNIKNFKSQRWQLLLNFQTERRLLLTGTPLQNNLMELWSLMHFLMPHVFQSHREFKEWFSNPMTGMIEGNSEYNDSIIKRLHKVLRPFLLRRLKAEVEKQMPKKFEHVVMCRLSKRQRYLYDDFMNRAKTRDTLAGGNLLSVINVLMQLRKVCNHPNLFEVRPTISPFQMDGISFCTASVVSNIFDYDPFTRIDLNCLNLVLIQLEMCLTAYVSHRIKKLATPRKLIEEIDTLPDQPPKCPYGKYKFHIRIRDSRVQENLVSHSGVKVGTSPTMKTEGNMLVPVINLDRKPFSVSENIIKVPNNSTINTSSMNLTPTSINTNLRRHPEKTSTHLTAFNTIAPTGNDGKLIGSTPQIAQIVQTSLGRHIVLTQAPSGTVVTQNGQKISVVSKSGPCSVVMAPTDKQLFRTSQRSTVLLPNTSNNNNGNLVAVLAQQLKTNSLPVTHNQKSQSMNIIPSIPDLDFYAPEQEQVKKANRQLKLQTISKFNQRRCEATPLYGQDCRISMEQLSKPSKSLDFSTWYSRSHTNCMTAMRRRDFWSLSKLIKTYEERVNELSGIFANFVAFVPAVSAPMPSLHVSHSHQSKPTVERDLITKDEFSSKMIILQPIVSAMYTQFPDTRLIQYDCGKLQILDQLLRRLKYEGHRALIFTQMTKMLDVLEAFLNYHGHIYLRLDGTTKIEQRQILMERFNGDKRVFAFILSTRSGGVGVNLTGADTVIFYDSDWNPTMDAQAQDRCHRIGQTRDVHIYRLVSEKTIEENILKKANQKRLLGDLAIEGGNFTTAYFKNTTIQDLFQVESSEDPSVRLSEILDRDSERKQKLQENVQSTASIGCIEEKSVLGAFESALAAAEDEQDVQAATTAKAEAAADLAEFDETIPFEEGDKLPEISKADQEVENLVKQLSPIERYAMRFVEETGGSWTAEQLRAAEEEIEQQKREWEANRLAALQKEEEMKKAEDDEDEYLTYSREDAKNQIWISDNTLESMPMWCPPTPPQHDNDLYIDYSLTFLYETDIMPESHLPPVYIKKEYKRTRNDAGFFIENKRPTKIRKEDNYYAPRSLFDRPSPALIKYRRDLKLQRYRGIFKPNLQIPGLKPQTAIKPLIEPEGMAEWCIYEDIAILHVLQNLQGLPLNLMLLSPGHTPNWDLVAEVVNLCSRAYRSPKHCRYRYEAIIVAREEGKLLDSPKKQKKIKNIMKAPSIKCGVKSLRTSQLYISDNNCTYTKLMKSKFDNIKSAYLKKAPPPKQVFGVPSQKNSKHVAVLTEFGIINYDNPLNPVEIALRKAEKLKEKQRGTLTLPISSQQSSEQIVQQQISVQQQPQATILVHQQSQISNPVQNVQQVTQIIQSSPIQSRQTNNLTIQQQTAQIVKAIVTPSSSVVSGQVQHISQATKQSQMQQQTGNIITPSSVSVVLTTPVSTVQQQGSQSAQIVSLQQHQQQHQHHHHHRHHPQQQINTSSSNIITQTASLVQTIPSQSLPQVVSVSQLATVGTVLTTSAALQSNATIAALNTSTLRAQRIVAAPGTLQEVVLQQRSNSQSPTIVSMSGLNQGVTQAQLQAAQLRLSMTGGQQISGVVAKGLSVGSLQQTGKLTNQPPQIQLYRQQALRQQLKVLQTSANQGSTSAVVQTAGGQTALVNASGTIIQSGIVPTGQTVQLQGQKVSVATVSNANVGNSGIVTSVATVQVAQGQVRPQFIKQVGLSGKQTITRQVTENEMLLVKRQLLHSHKAQVIPQTQIFTPANVQVQQAGTSSQQQIGALVKTSSGTIPTASVGMALSQIKPGQIKVTVANQNQVRQLQLQQQIAMAQQRKAGKMTQIGQVTGKSGVPTQLIVQNSKNLPGSVTVQQIQQVIRHGQPGTLSATGQLVLGKTSVGRVIPVSVSSQPNARQTIQVVSAASAQALAAGNLRAHVTGAQNVAGTIKVATGATQIQTQQALLNALQSQQNQRQNASPVRLQSASGSSLVTVAIPQVTVGNVNTPTTSITSAVGNVEVANLSQQAAQQQIRELNSNKGN